MRIKGNHTKIVNNSPYSKSSYYNEDNNNLFIRITPKLDNKTQDDSKNNSYLNYSNNYDNNRKVPYIYFKSRTPKRKCRFRKTNLKKDNSQIIMHNDSNDYIIQSPLNNDKYINKSINNDIDYFQSNTLSSKMSINTKEIYQDFDGKNKNDYITLLTINNLKNNEKNNKLKNIETRKDSSYQKNDFINSQRNNKFLDDYKKEKVFKKGRPELSKIIIRNQNNKSYDCKIFKEQIGLNRRKKNKRRNYTPNILEDSINDMKGTCIKKGCDRGGKVILYKNYDYISEKRNKKIILIQKIFRSYLFRKKNNILLKNRNNRNYKYKNKTNENGINYKDKYKDIQSSKNKKPNYVKSNPMSISINQISLGEEEYRYKSNNYTYLKKCYFRKPRFENSKDNNNRNKRSFTLEIMAKKNLNLEKRKLTPDFNRKIIDANSFLQITGENSLLIENDNNGNERQNSKNLSNSNISNGKYNNSIKNNNSSIYNKPIYLNNINYTDNNKNKNKLNNDNFSNYKIQNCNYINNDNDFQNHNYNNNYSDSYKYNKTNGNFNEEENDSNNIDAYNNNSVYSISENDNLNTNFNNNYKNNKKDLNINKNKVIYLYKNKNNLNNLKNGQGSNESNNNISNEDEANINNYNYINNITNDETNETNNNNFIYYSNNNQNNSINNQMNKSNNSFNCTKINTNVINNDKSYNKIYNNNNHYKYNNNNEDESEDNINNNDNNSYEYDNDYNNENNNDNNNYNNNYNDNNNDNNNYNDNYHNNYNYNYKDNDYNDNDNYYHNNNYNDDYNHKNDNNSNCNDINGNNNINDNINNYDLDYNNNLHYNNDEENNNIINEDEYLNDNNNIPNNESSQFSISQMKPKITNTKKTVLPKPKNNNNNAYNYSQNDSVQDNNDDDNYNNNFVYNSNNNSYCNVKSSSEYSNEENQNINDLRYKRNNNNSESLKTISNHYDNNESNKNNNSLYNTRQLNANSISSINNNIKKYINHPSSSNNSYENKSNKNTLKEYYNTKNSESLESGLSKRNNISSLKTIKFKYNKLYHKEYLRYIFKDSYMFYALYHLKYMGNYYKYYKSIYILKMLEQRIIKNMQQFCFFIIKGEGFVIKQNIFFNILKTYIKNTNLYINFNNDISKLLQKSNIEYYSNIYKNHKYIPYLRPTDEKNLINTQLFNQDIDFNNLISFICNYLKYEKNANDFSPELIKYYLETRPLKHFNIFTLTRYINSLHYILIFNSYNSKNILNNNKNKSKNKKNHTYNKDILKSKNVPKIKEYLIKRCLSSDNNKFNNLKKLSNVYSLKKKIGNGSEINIGNSTYDDNSRFNHLRNRNNDNIINKEIVNQIYEDYETNKKYLRSKSINYEKLDDYQVKRHVTKCSSCNIGNLLIGNINQANIPLVKKKFIYEKKKYQNNK